MAERKHTVLVIIDGKQIDGWIEADFGASYIEPSSRFVLKRAWSADVWRIARRDARVRIVIDTTTVVDGFIGIRRKSTKDHTLTIEGNDRASRLVAESAAAVNYDGLSLEEALRRICDPWIPNITLNDARNRNIRSGKGYRIAAGNEPIAVHRVVNRGQVHPGQPKWALAEEIASAGGYAIWMSADGKELFVGKPNQKQPATYRIIVAVPGSGSKTTAQDLEYEESNEDRYSRIDVVGTGGGTDTDYGANVSARRAFVTDVDSDTGNLLADRTTGTGRDFLYPKRMLMPESHFDSNRDAAEVARREQIRRDFRRTVVRATMPNFGQWLEVGGGGSPTLFTPGAMAHVRDEEMDPMLDDDFLVFAVRYTRSRGEGDRTVLEMVPRGTELVL